ncbi:replication initiator protein [Dipodfec virus UOA04_Rod_504]|nr:replication initiator protein [Dipodfec virus UOA04_Rod_504]
MCLNKKIIVNPKFIQQSALGTFPYISTPDGDFFYTRNPFDRFDYKTFHPSRMHVTESNIESFVAVRPSDGLCLPMYIVADCGHCPVCIQKKRTSIKHRMILEQYGREDPPVFLTLTYRDDDLPKDGVSVLDVQRFLKRFRSYVNYHYPNFNKFRYVCFSEYGKLHGRAHYHLILFGLGLTSPRDILKLEKDLYVTWQKGFVYAKLCDYGCFNYVSKYVCKGSNVPIGMNPNFKLASRKNGGIGVPAFENPSLYIQLIENPHPTVKIKVLGKVFDVYVPKSIRDNLFKSPLMMVPQQLVKKYKRFCFNSALMSALASNYDEISVIIDNFAAHHGYKYFKHVLNRHSSRIVPKEIHDKFAFINYTPEKFFIPSYMQDKEVLKPEFIQQFLLEYIRDYENLLNYDIDFGKIFEMRYLRNKFVDRWNCKLAEFAIKNPDRDPIALSDFNAIIISAESSKDCQ